MPPNGFATLSTPATSPEATLTNEASLTCGLTISRGYAQCHFFAGIGGWSIALRLAGWPDDRPVWTGSCPCQPFSAAGSGKAADDERHLWPAWFPLIAECRPAIVFGEQVEAAIGWGWLDAVFADLEGEGYACGATVLPACGVGAPHIRQRLWFVADARCGTWQTSQPGTDRAAKGRGQENNDPTERGRQSRFVADNQRNGRREGRALSPRGDEGIEPQGARVGLANDGGGELGHADQPGPQGQFIGGNGADQRIARPAGVAGFWSDAEWIACTDGKARPVESPAQQMGDGVSRAVGRLRADIQLKEKIDAATGVEFRNEILCAMRGGYGATEIWFALGRCLGFSKATLLFAGMREHSRELGDFIDGETSRVREIQKGTMRTVREPASPSRSPHGWQLPQQRAEQLTDALSRLSSESTSFREAAAALASFTGGPLGHGIQRRASKLRAFGNAIVPQVAAAFIEAALVAKMGTGR